MNGKSENEVEKKIRTKKLFFIRKNPLNWCTIETNEMSGNITNLIEIVGYYYMAHYNDMFHISLFSSSASLIYVIIWKPFTMQTTI